MSYIFRLHKEGNNALTDWGNSQKYGTNVIDQIKDPNGESAKREITSIPSPFARIDLVKTAFGKVAAMGVDGKTIHHKMVSEAFDIGQMFFEYEKLQDQLEIIVWDKQVHLEELQNSLNPEHRLLGKTYDIFLKQDGGMYNFDSMDRIYLLNFKNGPQITNIIGATSPATLFFTSANDLSYVSDVIRFGNNDRPFDDDYTPLYKRDLEYQKFWYAVAKTPNFPRMFPEVNKYLDENFKKLDAQKQQILRSVSVNDLQSYQDVTVNGDAGNVVYVLQDLPMKQKVQDLNRVAKQSGFLIQSDAAVGDKKPLVLPVTKYTKPTFYANGQWDSNTVVPYYDTTPVKDRILPDDGTKYPYLTISDFLQNNIVRMPYEIDKNNFFDGNINKADGYSYLLPLTDLFFTFFSAKDLTGKTMSDGKKMFELVNNAGGIKAILRIPIAAGYIEYSRTYFETAGPDIEHNDGALIDDKFGLGIMPLIKFPENVNKHYRIAMFDKGKTDTILTCRNGNDFIETKKVTRAKKDLSGRGCSHEAYVIEDNFDRIQVSVGDDVGYIVPKFKNEEKENGSAEYTFAIDFGTTNSHIEYCTGSNTKGCIPFDITKNDCQLYKLHNLYTDPDIRMGFEQEFVPETIGTKELHSFPMRTVFSHQKDIKPTQIPIPLADGNVPFLYEKDFTPNWNDIKTEELKWGGVLFEKLSEMYLETFFILMRNKVALNNGNLEATKIIWFYPASMIEPKVNNFKKIWKSAYEKYFGQNTENVICISESKAPYTYYIESQGANPECITIDVGGGTTDVYVVEREEPRMLLSFRFASNSIFGDGYNSNPSKNGFVKIYKSVFEKILNDNGLQSLSQALNQIESQNKSSDIIAFLFSLTGDKVKKNPDLNFLQQLMKNDKMRYVFIVFYASILYFVAKSMKAKGLLKPKTIGFSGNGSNSFRIISDEKDMQEKFVKLIFDTVYGDKSGATEVILEKNPKIATCKGGIMSPELKALKSQEYDEIDEIKTILLGNSFDTATNKKFTYADVTEDVENGVVQAVQDFFVFLFDLHTQNNDFLCNKLGADPEIFKQVKDFCLGEEGKQLLSTSMFKGLKKKQDDDKITDETKVEETLFFYPLIGVLHDLALKISEM
ncbi:hypothetical protein AGMMS49525_05310 [Bacteroidia bacterium]|nr:hypothetical protein AGMMS49525_05310 [Bacteroidia bacterium]